MSAGVLRVVTDVLESDLSEENHQFDLRSETKQWQPAHEIFEDHVTLVFSNLPYFESYSLFASSSDTPEHAIFENVPLRQLSGLSRAESVDLVEPTVEDGEND